MCLSMSAPCTDHYHLSKSSPDADMLSFTNKCKLSSYGGTNQTLEVLEEKTGREEFITSVQFPPLISKWKCRNGKQFREVQG